MTIEQRDAWARSLTQKKYDWYADRTYQVVEFRLRMINSDGDCFDQDNYDTFEDCYHEFGRTDLDEETAAVLISKVNLRIGYIEGDVKGQDDVALLAYKGNQDALDAGGWI